MLSSLFPLIFAVAIVAFAVDASISQVADFLIEYTTSALGISIFALFFVILLLLTYTLIRRIRKVSFEIRINSIQLRVVYTIALVTQLTLVGILAAVLFQILFYSAYYTVLLSITTVLSYTSAAIVMFISTVTFVSWFSLNRVSYVVLIFAAAFSINAYTYSYTGIIEAFIFAEKDQTIRPDSEVSYVTDTLEPGSTQAVLEDIYAYVDAGAFVLLVIGSATLLHHYAGQIGRIKFWVLLLFPLVYYLSTLVDVLGLYVPVSDVEFFNYYLYVSLNGVIGGALLGFAFWRISKNMSPNRKVSNYLRLCAVGFVFQSIATVGGVSAAAYPPFGFASLSMLSLSASMVLIGLYSTAISISQDVRLRQYIKQLTKTDSGFLSTIGQAQMEKYVQAKASDLEGVVKEQRIELEKKSGIQSSVQEQDIKQYLLEVLQEVDKHKSSL
jgi:hypothetical protein